MTNDNQSTGKGVTTDLTPQEQTQHPRSTLLGLPDELLEQCIGWAVTKPPTLVSLHTIPRYPKNLIHLDDERERSVFNVTFLPKGMKGVSRDRLPSSVSTKEKMLWIFWECRACNPKLWNIAVDQYYERNTFYARTMAIKRSLGQDFRAVLLDVPVERPHTRTLIVNVRPAHITRAPSNVAQFAAPYLEVVQRLVEIHPNIKSLTIRVEHSSYFAPSDATLRLSWETHPSDVLQEKTQIIRDFLKGLVNTVRDLEGRYLKSTFVELTQLANGYPDDYTWPEDFTDVEPSEDDKLLLWRLLDLPMGRIRL